MTSLNLANNDLGQLLPPEGWTIDYEQRSFKHADGRTSEEQPEGSKQFGVIALTDAIKDMGTLLVLSLDNNSLEADGGKALAEGLKGNQVITELNIAENDLSDEGTAAIIALADAISDMGALTKLDARLNDIDDDGKDALKKAAGSRCAWL